MLKKLSLFAVVLAFVFALMACGGSSDTELIGSWENGSGNRFLFVFDEADEVEFRANGTVVITQDGTSRTVNWELGDAPGTFTAADDDFTYSVYDDELTIIDSWNDSWTFDRQ